MRKHVKIAIKGFNMWQHKDAEAIISICSKRTASNFAQVQEMRHSAVHVRHGAGAEEPAAAARVMMTACCSCTGSAMPECMADIEKQRQKV